MSWSTPTLKALRALNRDNVTANLRSGPMIPNSVLRVMADSNAGLAYLTLLFIQWLSLQLLPDTAEDEWLIRWANIKGVPIGNASYASGTVTISGLEDTVVPQDAFDGADRKRAWRPADHPVSGHGGHDRWATVRRQCRSRP